MNLKNIVAGILLFAGLIGAVWGYLTYFPTKTYVIAADNIAKQEINLTMAEQTKQTIKSFDNLNKKWREQELSDTYDELAEARYFLSIYPQSKYFKSRVEYLTDKIDRIKKGLGIH